MSRPIDRDFKTLRKGDVVLVKANCTYDFDDADATSSKYLHLRVANTSVLIDRDDMAAEIHSVTYRVRKVGEWVYSEKWECVGKLIAIHENTGWFLPNKKNSIGEAPAPLTVDLLDLKSWKPDPAFLKTIKEDQQNEDPDDGISAPVQPHIPAVPDSASTATGDADERRPI